MTYTSYWRIQNQISATSRQDSFEDWMKTLFKSLGQEKDTLLKLQLTPFGWDDAAYFVIQKAAHGDNRFQTVIEQRILGDDGAHQVIRNYRQLLDQFMSAETGFATPLFCQSMGLFPEDLADSRAKTVDEYYLDQAQLCVEIEEFELAETWLQRVAQPVFDESLFAHTVARRLYSNWSLMNDEHSQARVKLAMNHAEKVIALYQQLATHDRYAAGRTVYHFGSEYKQVGAQLSFACVTVAEQLLSTPQHAVLALKYCELGESTNYGCAELQQLKIKALLKLDRAPEAWKIFTVWQHSLDDMPEITNSLGYQQFVATQNTADAQAQKARLAAIRITYADGQIATKDEIDALRLCFPALGERWPTKLLDARQAILQVEDGDILTIYKRFTPQESLHAHCEMLNWIHLHDNNPVWPEFATERDAYLKKSGIDPQQMLPIIGSEATPDCYLLRLDGGAGECGAIYQWSHDESANFEKIVNDMDEIFAYLADCARLGNGDYC